MNVRYLSLVFLLLHFTAKTLTSETLASETINVVTEDWPPFNYTLPDGSIGGIATNKVKAILNKAGLNYTFHLYPWVRAYNIALTKKNVLIYSIYRTKERETKFHWLCPLLPRFPFYAFSLSDRTDIKINNLDDLKHYRIGITKEEYVYQYLIGKGFKEPQQLDIAPNYNVNLRKLFEQRVDLVIEPMESIALRLKNAGLEYQRVTQVFEISTEEVVDNCMAFSLKTPIEIVDRVRQLLVEYNQINLRKKN